jgi:hypothetical protein
MVSPTPSSGHHRFVTEGINMSNETSKDKLLIDLLNKNHQFRTTDGVTRFMIGGGATVDSNDLRVIANELDRLNAE